MRLCPLAFSMHFPRLISIPQEKPDLSSPPPFSPSLFSPAFSLSLFSRRALRFSFRPRLFAVVMQFQRYTVASGMSAGGCVSSEPFPGWSTLQNFTRDVSRIRTAPSLESRGVRLDVHQKKKKRTRASSAF